METSQRLRNGWVQYFGYYPTLQDSNADKMGKRLTVDAV